MDAITAMLEHLATTAAGVLLSSVWEGAVLAACVALALRLSPSISAASRSMIWTAVLALITLLPFAVAGRPASSFLKADAAHVNISVGWAFALALLWTAFALIRALQFARSALYLRGIARRATPILFTTDLEDMLGRKKLKRYRAAEICSSTEVDVPSVAGFFSPRILLPSLVLAAVSDLDLRQIVLHEMEHLRRRDHWINLLQKISLVLFPLNPALLWVERRLCVEREMACDDGVLRATGAGKAYATCLANLAEHSIVRRGLSLALGAWEQQSVLVRRVNRILCRPEQQIGRRPARAVVGFILLTLLAGAIELARSPQIVQFSRTKNPTTAAALPANPISVRNPVGARPVLVNATMPGYRQTEQVHLPKRERRSDPAHAGKPSQWIMLTSWQTVVMPRRVTISLDSRSLDPLSLDTESPDGVSQFCFSAVPVQNGWLVVQI